MQPVLIVCSRLFSPYPLRSKHHPKYAASDTLKPLSVFRAREQVLTPVQDSPN